MASSAATGAWLLIGAWGLAGAAGCGGDGAPDARDGGRDGGEVDASPAGDAGPCTADTDCDDGTFCNGIETCTDGACAAGVAVGCDDGDECTADRCDEERRACVNAGRDADGDGYADAACGGDDCDDGDAARFPGGDEVCDPAAHDEDCDASTFGVRDADEDGWPDAMCCNADGAGGMTCGDDCHDARANVHPSLPEACDGLDNDCDASVDEEVARIFHRDADGDGFGDVAAATATGCLPPAGFVEDDTDCDDTRDDVHPGAVEACTLPAIDENCDGVANPGTLCECSGDVSRRCALPGACAAGTQRCVLGGWGACSIAPVMETCNSADDDCDARTDEGLTVDCYPDADGDGAAPTGAPLTPSCPDPERGAFGLCPAGRTNVAPLGAASDCADTDPTRRPGATDTCNGVDDDCDARTDEGAGSLTWYPDGDGDGFGLSAGTTVASCTPVPGHATRGGDCDDTRVEVNPGAREQCDGLDNDCNGLADFDLGGGDFEDDDGDRYVDARCPVVGTDCDDRRAEVRPGAAELCDGLDNDCDGTRDEGTSMTLWYIDRDRDSYGDGTAPTVTACVPPAGYVIRAGDCNDGDAARHPGVSDGCDLVDDDCDAEVDEDSARLPYYTDADGDGFGTGTAVLACFPPAGRAPRAGDCDDADPRRSPGEAETCNGVDDNCSGLVDEGVTSTFHRDTDGDGYGSTSAASVSACTAPAGYVAVGGDCDDVRASRHPGATETCNGLDDDCDGLVDDGGAAACMLANATSSCTMGACAVASCIGSFRDCDMVPTNGCELDVTNDPSNCGACGAACPVGPRSRAICTLSRCSLSCDPGFGDCNASATDGCEADLATAIDHCGRCGNVCPGRAQASRTCALGACGYSCNAGYADCDGLSGNGCETPTTADRNNCGSCGTACASNQACYGGACVAPFPSTGAEGPFPRAGDPMTGVVVLSAGVHNFTTIRVPAGMTVQTGGTGILDLRATGDIIIDGTIDVSGAPGAAGIGPGGCGAIGYNGGGGNTGNPTPPPAAVAGVCGPPGSGGRGAAGLAGTSSTCGLGGNNGGGAGGSGNAEGGGGGGGAAGGGGGGGQRATLPGGAGGSSGGSGGAGGPPFMGGDGGQSSAGVPYAGRRGFDNCVYQGGGSGGGGSIGAAAIGDLPMSTTLLPGSGGGGGGGEDLSCGAVAGGGGGGGGGGALRLASITTVVVNPGARLVANGGAGGNGGPPRGGAGGGGSGGAIYLSAPSVEVYGTVSAIGGGGGADCSGPGAGGPGGMGRVRVSADPTRCTLEGGWMPALAAGCALSPPAGTPGRVYIAAYPN